MKPLILIALALAACQGPTFPPSPAVPRGPASLSVVPPAYYSRTLRPGPARGPSHAAQDRREAREAPTVSPPEAPEPEQASELAQRLEDANQRLETLNRQLQRLRRSITRPANPPQPPPEAE